MRYDRRIPDPKPPLGEVEQHGRLQSAAPGALDIVEQADAWFVQGEAVFPLRRSGENFVAMTCLRRRGRLSKADRRMKRDAAREERWAA